MTKFGGLQVECKLAEPDLTVGRDGRCHGGTPSLGEKSSTAAGPSPPETPVAPTTAQSTYLGGQTCHIQRTRLELTQVTSALKVTRKRGRALGSGPEFIAWQERNRHARSTSPLRLLCSAAGHYFLHRFSRGPFHSFSTAPGERPNSLDCRNRVARRLWRHFGST